MLVGDFLSRLDDVLAPSKQYEYMRWKDTDLIVGEDWESQISSAITACDVGLLMVSPSFLASKYITDQELPTFVMGRKASVPVMLQRIDFELHDLKGLEKKQIFMLDSEAFTKPRAYAECKKHRRDSFVLELFRKIERKLSHATRKTMTGPEVDLRIFELGVQAYKRRGTPKYFLDSQSLTNEQRARLYESIVMSEKGRRPKNNPYR